MAVKEKPAQRAEAFATVLTVVSWAAIIPLLNIALPLAFQLWNEYSLIAFFGEVPAPEQIRAQHWKLDAARGGSIAGSVLIATAVIVLARSGIVRKSLFFAFGLSATLTVLWLVANR